MRLTENQQKILLLELEKINIENNLEKEKRSHDRPLSFGSIIDVVEYKSANVLVNRNERKKEINRLLATSEIIKNPNTRTIETGSQARIYLKFSDGDSDLLDIELIEKKVGSESSIAAFFGETSYITEDSALGKALLHKEVGEKFRYKEHNGKQVRGQVISLTFDRKEIGKTFVKATNKTSNR